jgi:hypothetical protein
MSPGRGFFVELRWISFWFLLSVSNLAARFGCAETSWKLPICAVVAGETDRRVVLARTPLRPDF